MSLAAAIAEAAARADFGQPSARKDGRDPRWPYVPVVVHEGRSSQVRGWSFRTRVEAIEQARRTIELRRRSLARRLADPRHRALREHHGLPREIPR